MVCSKPTWSFPASFPKEGIPSFPRPNDEPWTKTRGIQEVHDISWYFMKFMQSSGHFMAISTPQGYTHWLCTDRDWGAYHSIQHVLPHHFAKHGICPKTKDQVIVQRRGVLLHQLFLQHHLSIVAAHLLAPFQQVAALILAATMPCGRLHQYHEVAVLHEYVEHQQRITADHNHNTSANKMQGVLNFWHDWRCLDFPFFSEPKHPIYINLFTIFNY